MIRFEGAYMDGRSSRVLPVEVSANDGTMRIRGREEAFSRDAALDACTITPALGGTRRSILLLDGARCDTDDLAAVKALERGMGINAPMRVVHFLEKRWKWTMGCLAGLIVCVWLLGVYGIPLASNVAAHAVPRPVLEAVTLETMELLDKRFFEPSELDAWRADHIQGLFSTVLDEMDSEYDYRLELRKSPDIGPNAFALPDGLILMTDELVDLSLNDEELIGILRHETAHVQRRHGLRSIFQNAGVFLLISALVGDVASITSTAASIPILLAETGYSRQFEREADNAAGVYLLNRFGTTLPYREILVRLEKEAPNFPGSSWLSTHPGTEDRIDGMLDLERKTGK